MRPRDSPSCKACFSTRTRSSTQKAQGIVKRHSAQLIGSVDVLSSPMKDGVTIRDPKSASKHNPLNLATTLNYVKALIDDPIWKPQEITIITPY